MASDNTPGKGSYGSPTASDELLPCRFAGVTFPIQKMEIKGGVRDHVHEFPHTDGGAVEKLGRKLYEVNVSAVFASTFPKYPELWPNGIRTVIQFLETSASSPLILPAVGTMFVYGFDWTRGLSSDNLSGETLDISFREDASGSNFSAILKLNATNLESALSLADVTPIERNTDGAKLGNAFDQLHEAVNSVLAVKDTADVYTAIVVSKIEGVVSMCKKIDALASFNDPANASAIDALHDLWSVAVQMKSSAVTLAGGTNSGSLATYSTPRVMSIGEVSSALFGDTTHAMDILQMNAIDDAMSIPVRTPLLYFTP